jgi:hypothetical protein
MTSHLSHRLTHALPRFLLLATLLATLPLANKAQAEISTLGQAIDVAGSQRMLTQRMIRAYGQIALDVQTELAWEMRQQAADRFERQLDELIAFAPSDEIRQSQLTVRNLWAPFRTLVLGEVEKAQAQRLLREGDQLLGAAHRAVLVLEEYAGTGVARLVNISGRQRMLSQRLTQLYMMWAWGLNSGALQGEIQSAKSDFVAALEELAAAPQNTPRIQQLLTEVKRQWIVFNKSYQLRDGEFIPLLVALSSEKILTAMHETTGLYAELSAR